MDHRIYKGYNADERQGNSEDIREHFMRQHPTGPKRKESQGDWKSTRKYAELPSEEDCPPGGESSEVDPSSEGLSPNEIINQPHHKQEMLYTSLQTNNFEISSTSRTLRKRTSDPTHSKFSKTPLTTKDHLTNANPLHPSTHTGRVGPLDGKPCPSDGKECGRTGVSSGEALVVPIECQNDDHQYCCFVVNDRQIFCLLTAQKEEGCRVLLSNVPEFSEGERVPCPSRLVRSMHRVRHGKGFPIYHKNEAFIAEEAATPLDQLEVWSGLDHRNVLKLSAVLGDCDGHPKTNYQLTPVFTGDLKHLMTKCHLPSLRACLSSLFSDRVDLILWNVKYILSEILGGLEYLHRDEGIIHGNLKLQNILVDVRCNCVNIFKCPHEGDSGYRVYISDFDQAVHIGEGGATEWDDMSSFGLLLMEIFGISVVLLSSQCTAVERECVGLEGLYDVVSACHEINLEDIPRAAKLLQHSFFSLRPPGGVCNSTPPPQSPPDSCAVENTSPPLAVQVQQEPHDEGCKEVFGVKTPEKLAHLLTSEDSQSVAPYNISHSAVVEAVHSEDPAPILNHSSSISCVDSGSKDSDRVDPTQRPTVEEILKHPFFKLQNGDSPSRQDEPDPPEDHPPQRQKNEPDSTNELPLVLGKPTACASDENPGNPKLSLVTGYYRPLNPTENRMLLRISQDSSHSQSSAAASNSGQGRTSSAESCCWVAVPDGSVRDYHPKKKVDHERNYTKHRMRHLKAAQDRHERRMEH